MLAEKLGMTVGRLMNEMSMSEYMDWIAFSAYQTSQRKKAEREAKHGPNLLELDGDSFAKGFGL